MDQRQDTVGTYGWADHFARLYEDRADAGTVLAEHLLPFQNQNPLILGIPRGGVPVAYEIAARLGAELDVIVGRKLGAPQQSELALGAVTADGTRVLNQQLVDLLNVSSTYLDRVTAEQREEARRRDHMFRSGLPPLVTKGRVVILVDDGLATGATMRACVRALRNAEVAKLVIAVPVGSVEACKELAAEVDQLVCPWQPDPFFAVGAHYHRFGQVADGEVERLLKEQRKRCGPNQRPGAGPTRSFSAP
jgi:putative phosphoribosyl transferase